MNKQSKIRPDMVKVLKNNMSGITLIALAITIIVLLILARCIVKYDI